MQDLYYFCVFPYNFWVYWKQNQKCLEGSKSLVLFSSFSYILFCSFSYVLCSISYVFVFEGTKFVFLSCPHFLFLLFLYLLFQTEFDM